MRPIAHDPTLLYAELSHEVLGAFFQVHTALGHGFLEVVYRRAMTRALRQRGLDVATEVPFTIEFAGEPIGRYRADLVVAGKAIVECKAAEYLTAAHQAQILNYLRASGIGLGLLLNFGSRASFRRLVCTPGAHTRP